MIPSLVSFRCDGDERIGAGHVARCVQLAKAFRSGGSDVVFEGAFSGMPAALLETSGFPARPVRESAAGQNAEAVIVDSYVIGDREIEQMSRDRPTAVICDGARAPGATAVLSYHLGELATDPGTVAIVGVDYAPVSPELLTARRNRDFDRALVTMGGGRAGAEAISTAVRALRDIGGLEIFVATGVALPMDLLGPDLEHGAVRGLGDHLAWADVAVAAGGTTAYDLACAGVPAVLVSLANNQLPIVRALGRAGTALPVGAEAVAPTFAATIGRLQAPDCRTRLARTGPRLVDGYGAFRARDALAAALSARSVPQILRYRPATMADADRLLAWRNEPSVREWSRSTAEVDRQEHLHWLRSTLDDRRRTLLLVQSEGEPVGMARFDRAGNGAEISVTVDRSTRGAGVGAQMIRETSELLLAAFPELCRVTAEIHAANARSLRAFERAGFTECGGGGNAPQWRSFALDRAMLRATCGRWLEDRR